MVTPPFEAENILGRISGALAGVFGQAIETGETIFSEIVGTIIETLGDAIFSEWLSDLLQGIVGIGGIIAGWYLKNTFVLKLGVHLATRWKDFISHIATKQTSLNLLGSALSAGDWDTVLNLALSDWMLQMVRPRAPTPAPPPAPPREERLRYPVYEFGEKI